jgi:ATP-dependent RNA helicase DHX37/DHR1
LLSLDLNSSFTFIVLQAETLKEKLRRAAQFSRTGLVVPEELSLFKKHGYQEDSENSDTSEEDFPHKFADLTDAKECKRDLTGGKSKNVVENDTVKPVECDRMVDVGLRNPEPITEGTFDLSDILAHSTIKPSVPTRDEIDLQVNYISTVFIFTSSLSR